MSNDSVLTITTNNSASVRPPFRVSGLASLKHLNVRKEGPEDDKILAVDVKLQFSKVDRRLCAYFDEALEAFMWRGDTDALIARNAFVAPIAYANEISNASVEIAGRSFSGCDVKKFAMSAADGGVMTLTLSVSLYPNSGDVSDLAKLVQDDASVTIEGPPDLFAAEPDEQPSAQPDGDGDDPMYSQALALVQLEGKPSISLVQRTLKIGYNRAARLLEQMEKAGVVTPMNAAGVRSMVTA